MIHCFKLCGYNIVLDVASGSVHRVDNLAYDVISGYELVLDGKDRSVLVGRVLANHMGISEDDVLEVISDIEGLINRGKLFSPDTFAPAPLSAASPGALSGSSPAPLSALCLNVSNACNMVCEYCFAASPLSSLCGLMPLETGKRAIDFLVEKSGDRKNLDVDFFGGEPLLNWDVVKDVVRYARTVERSIGKRFRFTLTTNGLLIDEDVINFTNNQMKTVVLSLDGRPEVHDNFRKLPDGSGSYNSVFDNIQKLVTARREKGYYIRSTYTRVNMDFVNDILYLADMGFKELSFEPVVPGGGGLSGGTNLPGETNLSGGANLPDGNQESFYLKESDLPELFMQYEMLAVEMRRREKAGDGFNFYHYNVELKNAPCVHKRIAGCGVGTEYMVVTPSGELYPCHQFAENKDFLLGDVWSGVKNTGLRAEFLRTNIYSRSECINCWARFYCAGGCAANAYNSTGSIGGIYKLGCELLKKRIECAIMLQVAKELG